MLDISDRRFKDLVCPLKRKISNLRKEVFNTQVVHQNSIVQFKVSKREIYSIMES